MNGYASKELIKKSTVVGASETDLPLGDPDGKALSAGGSKYLRINISASSVTVTTGITCQIQQRVGQTWSDLSSANSSVSITADGDFSMKMAIDIAADQVDMPLSNQLRVTVTTGAGDAVTFDRIDLFQEL